MTVADLQSILLFAFDRKKNNLRTFSRIYLVLKCSNKMHLKHSFMQQIASGGILQFIFVQPKTQIKENDVKRQGFSVIRP